jgi:uncharacterized protein YjbJ (UPF0337 family)
MPAGRSATRSGAARDGNRDGTQLRDSLRPSNRNGSADGTLAIGQVLSFARVALPEQDRKRQNGRWALRARSRRDAMNWDRIEGNWKQFTGKVKEQWGQLTDDEITQINGDREQLEGRIQARYGYAKDQVRQEVDKWLSRQ